MVFPNPIRYFISRWRAPNGYREVLVVAFPLILSTGSWSLQHFVDRMFLTWYSPEAIAAAMPAGIVNFAVMSLFIGTASYVSTFVAQYYGAEQEQRIGPVMWQGIYLSALGGLVVLALIPLAGPFFRFVGHPEAVQQYEIVYFQILCFGGITAIGSAALSGFFSGRGETFPVMWINILGTAVNLVFDYLLIFGNFGFPRWGVPGAAFATVLSSVVTFFLFFFLATRGKYEQRFRTKSARRLDFPLLRRILRFGLPNGVQFFTDVAGFAVFLLLIGRLGTVELAATNIAFNINSLAFMPMIGIGIAVSILVGQSLGKNEVEDAERAAWSGFHITFLYMGTIALLYFVAPDLFLDPFAAGTEGASFVSIHALAVTLLRFVAFYSVFDTMNIVFAAAIKGAGDTRFVMYMLFALSAGVLVIPSYLAIIVFEAGVYIGWIIATAYVSLLGLAFLLRFLGGKWKHMRVIEVPPHTLAPTPPSTPTIENEL
ncbi:MAG: MATE family efflux transporter [Candidatus Latescibacterota bacterium]